MSAIHLALALAARTWLKTLRRPVTLTFSLAQPAIWMLFFGFLMQRYPLAALPEGVSYLSFLVPGIACMSLLLGASQAGVSFVRDIQTGFLQRTLDTPAPRWLLLAGKLLADVSRFLLQGLAVAFIGWLLGARLTLAPGPLAVALLAAALFAAAFASLSCLVALLARAQESLGTYVHLVNMPLFFTSTALVPQKQMPEWLATIAGYNPLSLAVNELRAVLLFGSWGDPPRALLVNGALALLLFGAATWALGFVARRRDATAP